MSTTSNQWVIRAKQRNGGEITFNFGGPEHDETGVRAAFEASHGRLYEILGVAPVDEGRSVLFVVPEVLPVPVTEEEIAAPSAPAPPTVVQRVEITAPKDDGNDDTAFGVEVV